MQMTFLFIGTPEVFIILLVIVIFFGSKKIPELARGLGKGIREFKNATSDIQEEIRRNADVVNKQADLGQQLKSRPNTKSPNDKDKQA